MALQIDRKNNINIIGNKNAAQTLVFGHGFGIDQTSFHEVAAQFEGDYRIILFDNVGGGKSDIQAYQPERYKTLQAYASDLGDICRFLDLEDAIYIGHSVSGMVGLLTAIQHPRYFSKLILLGASPRYLNDTAVNYTGGFEQVHLDGLYEAMHTNYQAWANGFSALAMGNADRPELAQAFANTLIDLRPDIALHVAKAIFESDHREVLKEITLPVLIVQTSDDIAVPAAVGDYMHAHIAGSQLVKVNTQGHFPHISAPGEVVAAIQQFIS